MWGIDTHGDAAADGHLYLAVVGQSATNSSVSYSFEAFTDVNYHLD